jgi:hypothetical protein
VAFLRYNNVEVINLNIIFLDIDGVMNSTKDRFSTRLENDIYWIRLKRLVDETNSAIVLSSSWRMGNSGRDIVHKRLQQFGMDFIDVTPIFSGQHRGREIADWLSRHEVESFVILDDEGDMDELVDHLVKTDMNVGLQDNDVDKAISLLRQ